MLLVKIIDNVNSPVLLGKYTNYTGAAVLQRDLSFTKNNYVCTPCNKAIPSLGIKSEKTSHSPQGEWFKGCPLQSAILPKSWRQNTEIDPNRHEI